MFLPQNEVQDFVRLHRSLMYFVNHRLGIFPDVTSPTEFAALPTEERWKLRNAFLNEVGLIESFVEENPANLDNDEIAIIRSWRDHVSGRFYAFRQLKNYMVFLSMEDPPIAYGVVALADPLDELIGRSLPALVETTLLPLNDKIVYDGLLGGFGIRFGGGIKRSLNDRYREAKQRLGIVTSLPIASIPFSTATKQQKTKKKTKKAKGTGSKDIKPTLEAIVGMTDHFCREHLNGEYAELCRTLADKLARKRPTPLMRGRPNTWASGIVRTIGWVNFLDDPSFQPFMKLAAIDKALGIAQSTGQTKSAEIRKMLNIKRCDVDWTLPSRMDDNPLAWMLEVNGLLIDVRDAPKEVQEIAFKKGLIPYDPAERKTGFMQEQSDDVESSSRQLYQFKITLNESSPAIWRRIQVEDCTLDKLHEHIQTAMGWTNSHLHQFDIDGRCFGDPELLDDGFVEFQCENSTVTKISDIVPQDGVRFRFVYEYDFGDGWEHEVLFEGCPTAEASAQYPLCVEGQRACPPEDVGGVHGYKEYLNALADPNDEQHVEFLQWRGRSDPDAFDATEATQFMRQGLTAWR